MMRIAFRFRKDAHLFGRTDAYCARTYHSIKCLRCEEMAIASGSRTWQEIRSGEPDRGERGLAWP